MIFLVLAQQLEGILGAFIIFFSTSGAEIAMISIRNCERAHSYLRDRDMTLVTCGVRESAAAKQKMLHEIFGAVAGAGAGAAQETDI